MRKTKKMVAVILGCMMLMGGALTASAAVKAMPYNTECPSCHYTAGERKEAYNCAFCSANGNKYQCGHCNHVYFRCENGHCYN